MSSSTPVPVVAAIQAVAFLLKNVETGNAADEITKQVTHSLIAKLDNNNLVDTISKQITDDITAKLVDHVVAAMSPQVALVHNASQTLTSTIEDMRSLYTSIGRERTEKEDNVKMAIDRIEDAADALYDSVETYQKALQTLAPSLDATQEKLDQLTTQITKTPAQVQGTVHPSYSSVVATHMPPQVDKALGRAALQACQILLDPLPGGILFLPMRRSLPGWADMKYLKMLNQYNATEAQESALSGDYYFKVKPNSEGSTAKGCNNDGVCCNACYKPRGKGYDVPMRRMDIDGRSWMIGDAGHLSARKRARKAARDMQNRLKT
ncbi:hypothetical protein F4604DRAFT_1692204 [Suillus subluteus]|nr:hypothetical protein F4604DRAFT_1692204 [Suillus subluteus]